MEGVGGWGTGKVGRRFCVRDGDFGGMGIDHEWARMGRGMREWEAIKDLSLYLRVQSHQA